ncbi:hypothetical protein D7Y23_18330 [Corallococcus sp. AB050B]|nr:hypothetical protein D7Y23_18330 [Corallococcus sp. AB050B]
MSDYLSHLVGRQLSPEAGVQPRIASRFAPGDLVPEQGAALVEGIEEQESPGVAPRRAGRAAPWSTVSRALASSEAERPPVASLGRERGARALEPDPGRAASEALSAPPVVARGLTFEVPVTPARAPDSAAPARAPVSSREAQGEGAPAPLPGASAEGPRDAVRPEPEPLDVRSMPREAVSPRRIASALRADEVPATSTRHREAAEPGSRPIPAPASPFSEERLSAVRGAGPRGPEAATERAAALTPEEGRGAEPASSRGGVRARGAEAPERGAEFPAAARVPSFPVQAERGGSAHGVPAPESAPAPVVQVTIGRIEVRAVTPPAPARPAPARTSPSLSLDEYLRRRNGGGR